MTSSNTTAKNTQTALIISIRCLMNKVPLSYLSTYSCTRKSIPMAVFQWKNQFQKAGDKIVLKALMDITLGVAACSVSESKCNRGTCSPVKIVVD